MAAFFPGRHRGCVRSTVASSKGRGPYVTGHRTGTGLAFGGGTLLAPPGPIGTGARTRSDTGNMDVRLCRVAELPAIHEIDRSAGQMFKEVGRPEVCGMLWHPEALAACRDEGRLWVIAGADEQPAGFLITDMVDGCVHVEQVSVDPACARRGLGRELLDHAAERATAAGLPALTLTTFADVPWNAPYYIRCGFRVLEDEEFTAGLQAIWQREESFWMGRWPRVCMRRDLAREAAP
jgi:ribosomal protein S18 acetylase RimI-like enzyme